MIEILAIYLQKQEHLQERKVRLMYRRFFFVDTGVCDSFAERFDDADGEEDLCDEVDTAANTGFVVADGIG
ncbi:unnamed protein product [Didymodactylos carnosus]|uniref:Uncharacterized protein n=1 Tax=Didymodactylos carnosus TaxID=1234261 RepID=A0A816DAF1_9BILA|nr:unnamed protein product [Didymodactylos carnosus]CAF4531249.1 unnamed protein product [Didymodactylos carnosus]